MSKLQFIYISLFLILLSACLAFREANIGNQLIWSAAFILILGIPHGAIDHLLLKKEKDLDKKTFYTAYLGLILINVSIWFIQPILALLFFLLLSAYHFGQSQFSFLEEGKISKLLFLSWGISILSGLILYNLTDINTLNTYISEANFSLENNSLFYLLATLWTSSVLTIVLLAYFVYRKNLRLERCAIELIILGIIHASFFLLPLIIGFTLYFVILHSLKVMLDEYHYLGTKSKGLSVSGFIKMLGPFSIVSVIGCLALAYLSHNGIIGVSLAFILLIALSSITLPHSIVMEMFYRKG